MFYQHHHFALVIDPHLLRGERGERGEGGKGDGGRGRKREDGRRGRVGRRVRRETYTNTVSVVNSNHPLLYFDYFLFGSLFLDSLLLLYHLGIH